MSSKQLHGPVTATWSGVDKPHISMPQRHAEVLSFDNINFKFVSLRAQTYNDNLSISNYLSLDILHCAYDFAIRFFHRIWPLIERFSLGVTAEALRANIRSKSAISLQRGRLT